MSRHQDKQGNKNSANRQGGAKKSSTSRGNAPVHKSFKPKQTVAPSKPKIDDGTMRLNKYIANSGACSRREADIYIASGAVKVNGKGITEMGYIVQVGDVVQFDGATVSPEKKVYILLNKPKNFTTANETETNGKNVFELVKNATKSAIQTIGRMDANTTGLLIFTNDTDMIRKFSLPSQKSAKIYQVTLDRNLRFEDLEKIAAGVTLSEHKVFVEEISYVDGQPKSEIGIKLRTANVKVVRAIFEKYQYDVIKIDRVVFAGLTKKNLARGDWRYLTVQEVINLKNV
jgi:23S rRNA pseudouridine2605 synthase